MSAPSQPEPTPTLVIFGASGDLTRRKLIPALYNNYHKGRLLKCPRIVGVSRTAYAHEAFRDRMKADVQQFAPETFSESTWADFARHLFYLAGDAADRDGMQAVAAGLRALEGDALVNRLYYLSVSPRLYPAIIAHLGAAGMTQAASGWRRVVIEKPFGVDLESAQTLNAQVHAVFDEAQVYRIDHYLGKETAQNILYYRFANSINEPLWHRDAIDNVQITVAESVDVGTRAAFYDGAGVLRDMFQNHLMQLLTLVAMEPPLSFEADALRDEKLKVLKALRPVQLADTVRAQYDGYRDAAGVAPDSQTATYAALKLYVDNWRWSGVPFYLRSGKALTRKATEVVITYKRPPYLLFRDMDAAALPPNVLSLCIQPDEGIHLRIQAKQPDAQTTMRSVDMSFHYRSAFQNTAIPDSYERLLLDALNGDAALFIRSDEIEAAWRVMDPILSGWQHAPDAPLLARYVPGTWGPTESDTLLARDGDAWTLGCVHDDDDSQQAPA